MAGDAASELPRTGIVKPRKTGPLEKWARGLVTHPSSMSNGPMTSLRSLLILALSAAPFTLAAPTPALAETLTVDAIFADADAAPQICLRDGEGQYLCTDLAPNAVGARDAAAGDLNADGDLDVVLAVGPDRPNLFCAGDGAGSFTCSPIGGLASTTGSIALGDMNGDGVLDVIAGNVTNQRNHVCLGDGAGGFDCGEISTATDETHDIAIGDVNGDGNADVLAANGGKPNRICLGDGTGEFNCAPIAADADDSYGVALGDLNGDGKLDAMFANVERLPGVDPQHNRACLGNGHGTFVCHDISPHAERSVRVALGDLDGDKDLDAVFANTNQQPNRACFNTGSGSFECHQIDSARFASSDVALVDLDGDKTLDVVFASSCHVGHRVEPNRACLNTGAGAFSCGDVSGDLTASSSVAVGAFAPF